MCVNVKMLTFGVQITNCTEIIADMRYDKEHDGISRGGA